LQTLGKTTNVTALPAAVADPAPVLHASHEAEFLFSDLNVDDLCENYSTGVSLRLKKQHLDQIREDIVDTVRPSYATIPPPEMGTAGSGKLKAGEWLAAYEFDLPVTLVHILATDKTLTNGSRELIKATLYLAIVIRFGLSNTTSAAHCDKYLDYYAKYMAIIRKLYPRIRLRPNQHAAFHFPDFLLRFGPARGFWMLPYERLIGRLQKMDMNFRPGPFLVLFCILALILPQVRWSQQCSSPMLQAQT
jgi:hypothetical protein